MISADDKNIFEAIRMNDEKAFETVFKESYQPLTAYAFRFTHDLALAENIVQDVFLKLWQNRQELMITSSLSHYLFRSVRNYSLNQLEKGKVRSAYASELIKSEEDRTDFGEFFPEIGLLQKIEKAIAELPPKRREIFRMAREEGLKYREIADKLELSVKTVEAQMTMALKQLREALREFRPIGLLFLLVTKGKSCFACHTLGKEQPDGG